MSYLHICINRLKQIFDFERLKIFLKKHVYEKNRKVKYSELNFGRGEHD